MMSENLAAFAKEAGFTSCTPTIQLMLEKYGVIIAHRCSDIVRGVMRDEGSNLSCQDANKIIAQIKELVGGWEC